MDFEKKRRYQSMKLIVSEAFMVLVVVVTVIVLAFVVSGYWLSADFEVRRQGMLQISSIPTGADIIIDGNSSWLQRTNTSKVLESGQHSITLTKEGYDSWSKIINISEGLRYRIHYPRLFLKNRFTEKALSTTGTTSAVVSPDHSTLILVNQTTEWSLINLDSEQITPKKLDIKSLFSSVSLADNATTGLFTGEILTTKWSANSNHVLLKVRSEKGTEWVLLNPKDIKNSINITREFKQDFADLKIYDNDANTLLALQNGNLYKLNISGRTITTPIIENIYDFDYYNDEIFFSAKDITTETSGYYLGTIKLGNDQITKLQDISIPAKVATTRFYEDRYYLALADNLLTVYSKEDFSPMLNFELTFIPATMKVGHEGEFITLHLDQKIATLDMESQALTEWVIEGPTFGWIDNDMIYTTVGGELIVYDFDGLNRRAITKNASDHFPAAITNNRYLYYFSNDSLIREWLIPR